MRVFLLGANGQLGWELQRTTAPLGSIVVVDAPQIDLRRIDSFKKLLFEAAPQVILNAAAYTAVDQAEVEPEIAMEVNAHAPGVLAELANQLGAVLIHYSTDYVFDGTGKLPYRESDIPNPINVYGKSKLLGEDSVSQTNPNHMILRTSWVYSLRRASFVNKILQLAREQDSIHIVTDQIGSPTWARMLAEATAMILAMSKNSRDPVGWLSEHGGLYHLAGSGLASRFEWAEEILNQAASGSEQRKITLFRATTDQFPTPARRPLFSALDCSKFETVFGIRLPSWKTALRLAMEGLTSSKS